MEKNKAAHARTQVQNALGTDLAGKASDAFCAEFVRPAPPGVGGSTGKPRQMRVVIELTPEHPCAPLSADAAARFGHIAGLKEALEDARAAVLKHAGEVAAWEGDALFNPRKVLRAAYVTEMRDRCSRIAAPVRDALERGVARVAASPPFAMEAARSDLQFSWLNQSFAVWVDLGGLAALAADPRISLVDLPRALELQIKGTGTVVGATKHRERTKHTGKGVVVAVIDSEVALLPDVFQGRMIRRADFTGEGWGLPAQHGTTVAGIIAANGKEAVGIAPEARIYNYKVVASNTVTGPEDLQGACALGQALEDGADIANCSWVTEAATDGTSREARACDNAWACGMTVVHAIGNGGAAAGVKAPADARGVIVVGATGISGTTVQRYSARGRTLNNKDCPDMVAPGGTSNRNIQSYLLDGSFGDCQSGTSFAAPHVTGILALLLEADPALTPDKQFERLKTLCQPLKHGTSADFGLGLPSLARLS